MTLEIAPQVDRDLEEIAAYIARDSRSRSDRLLLKIQSEMASIARSPLLYRLRPEVGMDARMAIVGRYLILFRARGSRIRIERVIHGSRDLPPLNQNTWEND